MLRDGRVATPGRRQEAAWPERVVVLGGGRWARVLTGVICDLVPPGSRVDVCSPGGWRSVMAWAQGHGLADRIHVSPTRVVAREPGRTVAIVACAARDHPKAATLALEYSAGVLVEKPFALTEAAAIRVAHEASSRAVLVGPAQVLRFTRYLDSFQRRVNAAGAVTRAALAWWDEAGEMRYGETKSYDSSIPVFADTLPHVIAVLESVFSECPERLELRSVDDGGAKVELALQFGRFECVAVVARGRSERRRRLDVSAGGRALSIDWTDEPGVIQDQDRMVSADPDWANGPRPLASMLTAFFQVSLSGTEDPRFSLESAFCSARLIESAQHQYRPRIIRWIAAALGAMSGKGAALSPALSYALSEFLQGAGRLSPDALSAQTDRLVTESMGLSQMQLVERLEQCSFSANP